MWHSIVTVMSWSLSIEDDSAGRHCYQYYHQVSDRGLHCLLFALIEHLKPHCLAPSLLLLLLLWWCKPQINFVHDDVVMTCPLSNASDEFCDMTWQLCCMTEMWHDMTVVLHDRSVTAAVLLWSSPWLLGESRDPPHHRLQQPATRAANDSSLFTITKKAPTRAFHI